MTTSAKNSCRFSLLLVTMGVLIAVPIRRAEPALIESFETGIPSGWTSTGSSGTSTAVSGLAPTDGSKFGFIDTSRNGNGTISTTPFQIQPGELFFFDVAFLTNPTAASYTGSAFVQLLDASSNSPVATLYTINPTGGGAISDGVQFSRSGSLALAPIGPLDNTIYGETTGGFIRSFYAPSPGSYSLLFEVNDPSGVSALAIDDIDPHVLARALPLCATLPTVGQQDECVEQAAANDAFVHGLQMPPPQQPPSTPGPVADPEPPSLLVLLAGLVSLSLIRRRSARRGGPVELIGTT